MCSRIASEFPRVFCFDTRDRVGNIKNPVYDSVIEKAEFVYNLDDLAQKIEKLPKEYRYIYKPQGDRQADFAQFCDYMDVIEIQDALIYVEEIGILTNTGHTSGIPPEFEKLLRFGRHNRIHLLINSQRPQDVHRMITAESSHIISFHMTESRDLAYFSGYFDSTALIGLRKYDFLCWRSGHTAIYDLNLTLVKSL